MISYCLLELCKTTKFSIKPSRNETGHNPKLPKYRNRKKSFKPSPRNKSKIDKNKLKKDRKNNHYEIRENNIFWSSLWSLKMGFNGLKQISSFETNYKGPAFR